MPNSIILLIGSHATISVSMFEIISHHKLKRVSNNKSNFIGNFMGLCPTKILKRLGYMAHREQLNFAIW